jgi:hypothetical protein
MSQTHVTIHSYCTGALESGQAVRNSIAFDLRALRVGRARIASAELSVGGRLAARCARARYTAAGDNAAYSQDTAEVAATPLNAAGLEDLRAAAGTFFSVEAVLEDHAGNPIRLSGQRSVSIVLTMERAARSVDSLVAAA